MDENELQQFIETGENLGLIVRITVEQPEFLKGLMKIGMDESRPENWRAIWMIDNIHEKHPELVVDLLPTITEYALLTRNNSKRRHLLKLVSLYEVPDHHMAELLNYCVNIFTTAAIPVAVRVHAMQILFNIAQKVPDFTGELIDMIEHEIEYHGSPGIKSRGRKLLKKLKFHSQPIGEKNKQ